MDAPKIHHLLPSVLMAEVVYDLFLLGTVVYFAAATFRQGGVGIEVEALAYAAGMSWFVTWVARRQVRRIAVYPDRLAFHRIGRTVDVPWTELLSVSQASGSGTIKWRWERGVIPTPTRYRDLRGLLDEAHTMAPQAVIDVPPPPGLRGSLGRRVVAALIMGAVWAVISVVISRLP